MAKSAQQAVGKWVERAGVASDDYVTGARNPSRSQSQSAIASKAVAQAAITEAFTSGRWEAGLRKSGDAGWLAGVEQKGANNFVTGVTAPAAQAKYVSNSGRYDSARNAASSKPRGPKGSAQNLARVAAVTQALRALKVGGAGA